MYIYIDRLHQLSPANHDREMRGLPGLPHIIIHVFDCHGGSRLPVTIRLMNRFTQSTFPFVVHGRECPLSIFITVGEYRLSLYTSRKYANCSRTLHTINDCIQCRLYRSNKGVGFTRPSSYGVRRHANYSMYHR